PPLRRRRRRSSDVGSLTSLSASLLTHTPLPAIRGCLVVADRLPEPDRGLGRKRLELAGSGLAQEHDRGPQVKCTELVAALDPWGRGQALAVAPAPGPQIDAPEVDVL